ncbi:hypothetical protein [Sinomonas sp. ASV322]|uniref:hypothetical protein n=1 Tax=Sinomonas sp. ASV322 TaxID=3041920 RepID=UPI0027DDEECC|nr:hypothetical protein [Sinomonas sp. ASV322]MDQ4501785.1 hypothetical protein [Sinomonas sp. ASV322]
MKRLLQVVNAVLAGFLGTLIVATTAILVLMFSTRGPGVRAVGLFGGVYFEAIDRSDGSMSLELGVENWTVFVALWLVLSVLAFVSILIFGWLRRYREALVEHGPDIR